MDDLVRDELTHEILALTLILWERADLADHVRELAFVGDLEAARIACEALAQFLGTSDASSPVVDLARVRGRGRR